MEKKRLATSLVDSKTTQKENMDPTTVVSPIRSSEADPSSATSLVLQQCNDLLSLQARLILSEIQTRREQKQIYERSRIEFEDVYSQLENEKLKHSEILLALEAEKEKLQMALTEIDVLRKQLEREKTTFEKAFGLAKSQALSDSSKTEQVLVKCTGLETLCAKKDEELASKTKQVETLQRKIRQMKETHKQELEELHLKIQQELYVAQTLSNSKLPTAAAARKKQSRKKQ